MKNKSKQPKAALTFIGKIALCCILSATLTVGCSTANNTDVNTDVQASDNSSVDIPHESEYTEQEAKITVDENKKADDKFVKEDVYTTEKDESTGSSIELKYPVAQASEYGEGAEEYNALIKSYIDIVVAKYEELLPTADDAYSFKSDYEIYCKEDGYLSSIIKVNISDGTQNITSYISFNYDMNKKIQLIQSPYVNCSDFDGVAMSLIKFDIEQRPSNYFAEVAADFSQYYQYANMVFDKESVSFIYEPGRIADSSRGEVVFKYAISRFNN